MYIYMYKVISGYNLVVEYRFCIYIQKREQEFNRKMGKRYMNFYERKYKWFSFKIFLFIYMCL